MTDTPLPPPSWRLGQMLSDSPRRLRRLSSERLGERKRHEEMGESEVEGRRLKSDDASSSWKVEEVSEERE